MNTTIVAPSPTHTKGVVDDVQTPSYPQQGYYEIPLTQPTYSATLLTGRGGTRTLYP